MFTGYLTKPVRQSLLYKCVSRRCKNVHGRPSRASLPAQRQHTRSSALKYLVVEDNLDNQKVLVHMLERYGCRVDVARQRARSRARHRADGL